MAPASRTSLRRMAGMVTLALLALQLTITPVGAAGDRARPHCVVTIEPVKPSESESREHSLRCYARFSDAIADATDGHLRLHPDTQPYELTAGQVAASAGPTVIGIDYEDPNYDVNFFGPSLTWSVGNEFGCLGGRNYSAAAMPAGWDNQVSSAKAFAGCSRYYHYEHPGFGGILVNCSPGCAGMGAMNDKTSSERWWDV